MAAKCKYQQLTQHSHVIVVALCCNIQSTVSVTGASAQHFLHAMIQQASIERVEIHRLTFVYGCMMVTSTSGLTACAVTQEAKHTCGHVQQQISIFQYKRVSCTPCVIYRACLTGSRGECHMHAIQRHVHCMSDSPAPGMSLFSNGIMFITIPISNINAQQASVAASS
jgi:hypothetical protein